MILLDSYAVLALLRGEAAAPAVAELLRSHPDSLLTSIGLAEVVDNLIRLSAATPEDASIDLAALRLNEPIDLDMQLGMRAGLLRAQHYDRRSRDLSIVDCIVAETARQFAIPVATADPSLIRTCLEEGIEVIVLPDTRGEMWQG